MILLALAACAVALAFYRPRRRNSSSDDGPHLIEGVLSLHDAFEGVIVTGGPGSGKTTGPLTEIYLNLLKQGAGILWLCAKVDEFESRVLPLCQAAGRLKDVVRFAPDADEKCDILTVEMNSPGGSIDSCAALLTMLSDVSSRAGSSGGAGGDEAFWAKENAKCFRRAIAACWKANGRVSLSDVYLMLTSAPTSTEQASSQEWRAVSFCWKTLERGFEVCLEDDDFAMSAQYWLVEWAGLDPRTRGNIMATATGCLDPLMNGPMTRMIAGGVTTTGPEDVLKGRVLAIDMPVLRYQEQGVLFSVMMKTLVQRAALRRDASKDAKVVAIFADECQNFILGRQDMLVSTMARSARLISINTYQNMPLMYAALGGGDRARQEVDAWASCHMTKIAMGNTCPTTGRFYSDLFGSSYHETWNGNSGSGDGYSLSDDLFGRRMKGGPTVGWSEAWRPDVPPEEFSKLRKPTRERPVAEGYIHMGGKLFAGRTWARIDFRQRFFPDVKGWHPAPKAAPTESAHGLPAPAPSVIDIPASDLAEAARDESART